MVLIIIHLKIFVFTFFHFARNPVPVTLRSEWNSTDILWLLLVTCVTIFRMMMHQGFYLIVLHSFATLMVPHLLRGFYLRILHRGGVVSWDPKKRLYNSFTTPNGARYATRILPSSTSPFEDPRADQDLCHSSSSSRQCRHHQTPRSKTCKNIHHQILRLRPNAKMFKISKFSTSTQSQIQPLVECGLSRSKLSKFNSIAEPLATYCNTA